MPAPSNRTVVLVTGCTTGGIGWHLCAALAARPDALVFASARRLTAMEGLQERGCRLVQLDVTKADSVKAAVEQVITDAGRIDVLVNNAGIAFRKPCTDFSMDEVRAIFEVNYMGMVAMAAAVTPHMIAARSGRIYNVGSGLAYFPVPFMGHYAASKHAVRAYTDTLRVELAPFGLKVTFVAPGYVKTHIHHADDERLPPGSIYHSFPSVVKYVASTVFFGTSYEAATPAERFSGRLARVVMSKSPPRHYLDGHYWWFPWIVSKVVPLWIMDWGYALELRMLPNSMLKKEIKTQ